MSCTPLDPISVLLSIPSFMSRLSESTFNGRSNLFARHRISLRFTSSRHLERAFIIWRTLEERHSLVFSLFGTGLFFALLSAATFISQASSSQPFDSTRSLSRFASVASDGFKRFAEPILFFLLGIEMLLSSAVVSVLSRRLSYGRELLFHRRILPALALSNFFTVAVWFGGTPASSSKYATAVGVLYLFATLHVLCNVVYRLRLETLFVVLPTQICFLLVAYALRWQDVSSSLLLFDFYIKTIIVAFLWAWVLVATRLMEWQERDMFLDQVILRFKSDKTHQLLSL